MELFGLIIILQIIILIWLGLVTFYMRRSMEHYDMLTRGISKKTLTDFLEKLSGDLNLSKKHIASLISRCDTIEKDQKFFLQKIGFLRFNPFKDTGGDQSFILTLADANNTGIVMTGLYTRSGVRIYIKRVHNGKGIEHELSDEEHKALINSGNQIHAK